MLASFYFKLLDTFKQYLQYGKLIETELLFFESYVSPCLIPNSKFQENYQRSVHPT